MEVFLGTIMTVGFNYAPRGWALCNGQLLSISQNSALFALLGTAYGGDGQNTFGLPDLRGRVAAGAQGPGPGLQNIAQGEKSGVNSTTVMATGSTSINLTLANLPSHTHTGSISGSGFTATSTLNATTSGPGTAAPTAGAMLSNSGQGQGGANVYLSGTTTPAVALNAASVGTTITGDANFTTAATGNGTPFNAPVSTTANASVMQPYLGLYYIIATEGIFPSRN